MFDIGFWELAILFGLGLMVLGPERLPKVASSIGRWAGQARNMARHLQNQMREEMEPLQKSVDSVQEGLQKDLNQTVNTDWAARRPEPGALSDNSDASDAPADEPSAPTTSTDAGETKPESDDKNDQPAGLA